jgi:hypothetical protein
LDPQHYAIGSISFALLGGSKMEGVEILNEVVVSNHPVAGVIILICGILISLVSLVALVMAIKEESSPAIVGFVATCVLGGLFIGFGIDELNQQPETHYQVTIDYSVPMNEFYKKYEIIEVEGKIYTIKEKTPNG